MRIAMSRHTFFFLALSFLLSLNVESLCTDEFFSSVAFSKNISHCKKLKALGAEFGWNFIIRTVNYTTFDVVFGARLHTNGERKLPRGWVAWGVNPFRPQMIGTRAVIAFKPENGSSVPFVSAKYNVTQDTKKGCKFVPSEVDVKYEDINVAYIDSISYLTMYLRVTLPSQIYNVSKLNHVWQVGSQVMGMEPKMHDKTVQNFDSSEVIDLNTGRTVGHHPRQLRKVHGILNMIGWGTLLPFGIIIARYFSKYPFEYGRWFRLHLTCQVLAFTIGTIGWALGISLGNHSKNYTFTTHRYLGISIYAVAILQMLALWLRPKKNDDYRKYWHIYHHFLGYSLFALIVVNIFQGISILRPEEQWKWAYVGILSGLGLIVLVFESITWGKFIYETRMKKKENKP